MLRGGAVHVVVRTVAGPAPVVPSHVSVIVSEPSVRQRTRSTSGHEIAAARAGGDPEAAMSAREVYAAVAGLPDEFRDVLVAVDVAGLSYAEAARALRIRQGTVMSRLHRARARVAERVG